MTGYGVVATSSAAGWELDISGIGTVHSLHLDDAEAMAIDMITRRTGEAAANVQLEMTTREGPGIQLDRPAVCDLDCSWCRNAGATPSGLDDLRCDVGCARCDEPA